jgi:hypothetical protein
VAISPTHEAPGHERPLGGVKPVLVAAVEPAAHVARQQPRPTERTIVAEALEYRDRVAEQVEQRVGASLRLPGQARVCELDARSQLDPLVPCGSR